MYVADVIDFLNARPRRDAAPTASMPAVSRAGLELRDVHFSYPGAPEPAICGIDLTIAPGETIALVGENGAGKTTLVKLLARLYDPDQGSILFDGVDLRDLPRADLQRRIAFVFQGFGRYEASAADNIAYGDWQRLLGDRDGVAAVARTAGVDALIAGLPAGYDTHLGRLFGESDLSAGQWQKLAVARAFARQAALLILDDRPPTSDARAEHALFEQFRALAEGAPPSSCRTASTVSMAQRIVVLEKGRIVETGTHADARARRALRDALQPARAHRPAGGGLRRCPCSRCHPTTGLPRDRAPGRLSDRHRAALAVGVRLPARAARVGGPPPLAAAAGHGSAVDRGADGDAERDRRHRREAG